MAEVYDNAIDKTIDWGGDANTGGFPVTGRRVQEFIKNELEHRAGVFYYDASVSRYLVFADEANRDAYLADPTNNAELLLAAFDAPSNYDAVINLSSESFNAVLLGSTGNYLEFTFDTLNKSGASVGESVTCTYTFVRGGTRTVVTEQYRAGLAVRFNIDQYLQEGTNSITIGIVGDTTLAATTVGVTYQVVNLTLESSYDISTVHNLLTTPDAVAEIPYTIAGTGTKTVEWYLDGAQLEYESTDEVVEIETTRTKNISMAGLAQGKHSIQARAYVTVNGEKFYSNVLYMDAIVYTAADRNPIIAVAAEIPSQYGIQTGVLKLYGVEQYTPYTFKFAVYNPTGAASTEATVSVGGEVQGTVTTANNTVYPYTVRVNTTGTTTLKITADGVSYDATMEVAESSMDIVENNSNLLLNLYALGRTNEDTNKDVWDSNGYKTTFDGFQWNATSGWNDNRLVIADGASIEVDLAPFSGRVTTTGLTVELEFSTENVNDYNAVVCDLRSTSGNGLLVTASSAELTSAGGAKVSTRYKSGENIRVAFVVNQATGVTNKGLVFVYIDGILSGAETFSENDNFISDTLLKIGGSADVAVRLKHVRIYEAALSSDEVLNNYIIYRDTSAEMMTVFNRNNVMDGRAFDLDALAAQCPVLKVTGDIPTLENTTSKDETIYVDVEYINMQDPTRNFTGTHLRMRPQGKSSMGYPKKNFRLYTDKDDASRIYDYNGEEIADRLYSFKAGAQPVNCWCFKADYAESSGTHNTGIARIWNDLMYNAQIDGEYKLRTNAQQIAADSGYPYDVRTTIDGFPCHIVYRLDEESDWVYIGKYNFNNDKSTESVFGFEGIEGFDNSRMQCWEILNNGNHLALFEDVINFDSEWENAYEARYPDDGSDADTTDLKAFCEWVVSTKDNVEKFSAEKWEHLDVYKAAAYYIYVMRFGAVDQTVKNSMLTSEDGEHFYWINYDNDTINGLRNDGLLAFDFTIDRESLDPNYNISPDPEHQTSVYVYAGHGSTLWNNMEADDEFMAIVAEVDQALYTAGLSYANVIKMFDDEQSAKWNERVYNQDAQYKYIGPYTDKGTNNLFMLQGARRAHRRWWLSHRFDLIDSRFISGKFKANIIDFKLMNDTPIGQQFTIEAGNLLYYGYGVNDIPAETGVKLDKGESYTFTTQEVLNIGDPIRIYSAPNIRRLDLNQLMSRLTQLGLSGVYDEENGSQLKSLIIGNGTSVNTGLTEISALAQAKALEELDIRGCLGITSLSLGELKTLTTFRAQNSGLTSFVPAEGALLSEVYLPEGLTGMTLKSLAFLTSLNIDGAGKNLSTIQISGCPALTNSFAFFETWYGAKTTENRLCTVELDNVNWQGLTPEQLINFGQIKVDGGLLKLKGRASITESSEEIVAELSAVYGENVFNPTAEFYISAPAAMYLTGPDEVMEGSTAQYVAAVFGDNAGTVEWSITSGGTGYESIDQYGLLTTTYRGSARTITIQAKHTPTSGTVETKTKEVKILQQVRPTGGTISGDDIAVNGSAYTLAVTPSGVNTEYSVAWSLSGTAYDEGKVSIKSQDSAGCVLAVVSGANGDVTLTATITDVAGKTVAVTKAITFGTMLTMKMTTAQGDSDALADAEATVTVGSTSYTVKNGSTIAIASGVTATVVFASVQGFFTPDSQEVVIGAEALTVTGVYELKVGSWITIDQTITDPATMISGDVNGEHIQLIRNNSHRYLGYYDSANSKMDLTQLRDTDSTHFADKTSGPEYPYLNVDYYDVWMKLPRFWYKAVEKATDIWNIAFYYGDAAPDDTWKEWDGKELIGVYEAYHYADNTKNVLLSKSGVTSSGSISQENFKAYARNRGTGFTIVKWKQHCIMAFLYYAMYGHMNCQEKIGAGTGIYYKSCGQTDTCGMRDTRGTSPVSGLNDAGVDGNNQSINFWGLENWWGNKYEWIDNVVVDAYEWKITEPDGTVRTPGKAYTSSNYIAKMMFGDNCDLIPTAASGSSTTGFCDYYYGSSSTARVVLRSCYDAHADGGVAFVYADSDSSYAISSVGSRLAFRGELNILSSAAFITKYPNSCYGGDDDDSSGGTGSNPI